jgi:3-hydroxyisobutyrate dehydrogenase-like beta-hydroxyacid dehydrogenase
MRIGFIGLGTVGAPIANNLRKAGHTLTVWNRTASRADRLAKKGASVALTPRACASGQSLVFVCVSDDKALEAVLEGPDGVLAGLGPDQILIDCGTTGTRAARALEERARGKGADFLCAPLLGSKGAAEQAQLTIIVGGSVEARERARPALHAISAHIVELERPVQAALMKLVVNDVGSAMMASLAEAVALGATGGLDAGKIIETLQSSGYHSPFYLMKGEQILAQDYLPRFSLALAEKDLRLTQEAAQEQGAKLPISTAIRSLFADGIASGRGEKDVAAVAELYLEWAKSKK